jgi:predicted glycoside hydrolase/deacetylase ChbG (UPF0249 family)
MTIQLLVTCDDCGLSEGINLTVARLHEQGLATCASLMTNFPAVPHALDLFRQYPALELGVHLNLSDGYPLSSLGPNSELTRADGQFRDRYMLFARGVFPSEGMMEQIRMELRAQIDVLCQAGIRPAHLTTHCHFHVLPALRELVYDLAEEYGVIWVRSYSHKATSTPYNLLIDKGTKERQTGAFVVPDYLVTLRHWLDRSPEALLTELHSLNGTVEIVMHAGMMNDETFPPDVRYTPQDRYYETMYMEKVYRLMQAQGSPDIIIRPLSGAPGPS